MNGEVFTRYELEGMDNWRATFRYIIAVASPLDRVVCLMKKPGKEPGYFWKMPGMTHTEDVDLGKLQQAIQERRLELVRGHLPRGVQALKQKRKRGKRRKVRMAVKSKVNKVPSSTQ